MLSKSEDDDDEMTELEKRMDAANMPEHALKVARKELKVSAVSAMPVASR